MDAWADDVLVADSSREPETGRDGGAEGPGALGARAGSGTTERPAGAAYAPEGESGLWAERARSLFTEAVPDPTGEPPEAAGGDAPTPLDGRGVEPARSARNRTQDGAEGTEPVRTSGVAENRGDGSGSAARGPERGAVARRGVRRGAADPVKALMHQHRELCARAVDPLEIAAGLEAHGVTDRTAARFRHRDVFSLAEELYARVPRDEAPPGGAPAAVADQVTRGARGMLHLVPGTGCAAAVAGVGLTAGAQPAVRLGIAAAGAAVVTIALWLCLRRGPLRARGRRPGVGLPLTCWLIGYLAFGDALLGDALHAEATADGSAYGYDYGGVAAALGLTFAVAPAAWCARWFAAGARRRLAASRGLEEFAAGIRPLLPATVAVFLLFLTALLLAARVALRAAGGHGPYVDPVALASAAALGVLFFIARLLAVHGRPAPAVTGLAAACAGEAAALGTALADRLPGLGALGAPVRAAVAAYGPGVVPLAACATTAIALLAFATVALARASAHSCTPAAQY